MTILLGVIFSLLTSHALPLLPQISSIQMGLSAQPAPDRTLAEARYIRLNYGVWFAPKKPSRKERLALALSHVFESDQ